MNRYQSCIDACNDCSAECERCASACLEEANVDQFTRCIKQNLDCALICAMASKLMARGSEEAQNICGYCAEVCRSCASECRVHKSDHCQQCADVCEQCADECEKMAVELVR